MAKHSTTTNKGAPEIPGWDVKVSANGQVVLYSGSGSSGISIYINKGKRTLQVSGWYDSFVGIEGQEISLDALSALFPKRKAQ